jgi:hypothetical protein
MNAHKMFRSFLFACMGIVMAACANVQTQPTALASDTTAPTATVATATAPAPTETATLVPPTPTEAPQIPPDLTAKSRQEASKNVLPYCVVHPDMHDMDGSSLKVFNDLTADIALATPKTEMGKLLKGKMDNQEIKGYGVLIIDQPDGSGGCIVILVFKDKMNGQPTSVFFDSKLDGKLVEVKIVPK